MQFELAALAAATAQALRGRGVAEPAASHTAAVGIAIFKVAFELWVDAAEERKLARIIRDLLAELETVAAGG